MIKEYIFGKPFETYAVVDRTGIITEVANEDVAKRIGFKKDEADRALSPYGGITWDDSEYVMTYAVDMGKDDIVYGLGENIRGINKRGWIYESKCSDDPIHDEFKSSLYGVHNFIMMSGEKVYGLFIDYPGRVIWDIGYSHINKMQVLVCSENFKLYVINSEVADKKEQYRDIIKQFRKMIGQSYVAPRWAFGFQQSRWGYHAALCTRRYWLWSIRALFQSYREKGLWSAITESTPRPNLWR